MENCHTKDLLNSTLNAISESNYIEAVHFASQIVESDASHDLAWLILGVAKSNIENKSDGLPFIERAVNLAPEKANYRYNYAVTLHESGQTKSAMIQYQACLRLAPDFTDALWNYGELLRLNEKFELALACFDRIAALGIHYPSLLHRSAVCCAVLKLDERSESLFRSALEEDDSALTHWEYGHFLLARERFNEGWPHYAYRFKCGNVISVFCSPFPYPEWQGQLTPNMTLLIHGEQGLGDEIMFSSVLTDLSKEAELINAEIILACRPTLMNLFKQSFPSLKVLPHVVGDQVVDLQEFPEITAQCPIASLARWRRNSVASFAQHESYLKAAIPHINYFKERLASPALQLPPSNLKIGLAWGSNPIVRSIHGLQRNIPIKELIILSDVNGASFISLQNKDRGFELGDLPELNAIDFSHQLTDFSVTAGLIHNMDIVITVCTSLAHLSGAMGKETWVLLQYRSEWRWGIDREDSLWYPNIKIFRQKKSGEWGEVLNRVKLSLNERVKLHHNTRVCK